MNTERIDVLAVMDRLIGNTRTMTGLTGDPRMREHLSEGEQARAAVAELIAADVEYTVSLQIFSATRRNSDDPSTQAALDRWNAAIDRRHVAIAKVQPA